MAQRIFLHVASTKSGTTFLQRVLWSHRSQLLEQRMLLPGSNFRDHYKASLDVREEPHRIPTPDGATGAWGRLVEEMAAWEGDALVSHELFAPATADQASVAIGMLNPAEVHLVVTARDLARQVPAEWQEHVKHRSVLTFSDFVHELRTDPERGPFAPTGYHFWHEQDLCGVIERWGRELPPERVHLVTVPRAGAGPDELWQRFTGVMGIDGGSFDLTRSRTNSSVRAEQADLLRRLNSRLGSRLPRPGGYGPMVKSLLANQLLSDRPGTRFGLQGEDWAFAVERAETMVAGLERLQVHVVGDIRELVPDGTTEHMSGDARVAPEAVLDEAVEALAAVLDRFSAERARRQRMEADLRESRTALSDLEARLLPADGGFTHLAARFARRARRVLDRRG